MAGKKKLHQAAAMILGAMILSGALFGCGETASGTGAGAQENTEQPAQAGTEAAPEAQAEPGVTPEAQAEPGATPEAQAEPEAAAPEAQEGTETAQAEGADEASSPEQNAAAEQPAAAENAAAEQAAATEQTAAAEEIAATEQTAAAEEIAAAEQAAAAEPEKTSEDIEADSARQEQAAEQEPDTEPELATEAEPATAPASAHLAAEAIDAIPEGEWRQVVSFPDWKGYVDDTLAMNGMYSFPFWHGQGTLYISVGEETTGFRLIVNGIEADTSQVEAGGSYALDFAGVAVNGRNTLEVTGIRPLGGNGTVTVYVPFPEVLAGNAQEEGIEPEALQLISDIIQSDIDHGFTSAQMAVVRNGRLVYENAWGRVNSYAQDGTPLMDSPPVTTETLYDLASVTKMFSTNYALQKLVTDGEIGLNDRIVDYLGEQFAEDIVPIDFGGGVGTDPDVQREWKSALTIGDLLKHQGGFPPSGGFANIHFNVVLQKNDPSVINPLFVEGNADEETREATFAAICKTPLMYEPGTKTQYSDIDFIVLGWIVEAVTGQDLDSYLKENFCEPLGLEHVTYNPLQHGFGKDDCAATELNGNTRDGVVDFPNVRTETIQGEVHDECAYYNLAGLSGHAGLFANASDLAKLAAVMLTGGYGTEKFFSENVMDNFTAPKSIEAANWGLGWWRQGDEQRPWYFGTQAGDEAIGHQGWTGTLVMIDPTRDMVVVYLTNKINTPVTDPENDPNKFDGNWYTASTLGFVPQILSLGMEDESPDAQILDHLTGVVLDMALESIRHAENSAGGTILAKESHPLLQNVESKLALAENYAARSGKETYIREAQELRTLWEEKLRAARETAAEEQAQAQAQGQEEAAAAEASAIVTGDARFDEYLPLLEGKRVAIYSNQSGIVGGEEGGEHILDALIEREVDIEAVFCPEHGFRGNEDAGAAVSDSVDEKTGVPIFSLYGGADTPSEDEMDMFDTLVVDIQDVGTRFYTYHITMADLMSACARYGKKVIVLDRPNPNGFYTAGPILQEGYQSGVGRLPIPVVHGMTIGELAQMIVGEGWLRAVADASELDLTVIPCEGYTHDSVCELPVAPSPNLKDMQAVWLYPSICFFENTAVSVGRGTDNPFTVYGSPLLEGVDGYEYTFEPQSMTGAHNPPYEGQTCYGRDLRDIPAEEIRAEGLSLDYLIEAYTAVKEASPNSRFFGMPDSGGRYWIDKLAGTDSLRIMVEQGYSAQEIRESWENDLEYFKELREPYMLYE